MASPKHLRIAFEVIEDAALNGGADWLLLRTDQDWQALGALINLEHRLGQPGPWLDEDATRVFTSAWTGEAGWRACCTLNEAMRIAWSFPADFKGFA